MGWPSARTGGGTECRHEPLPPAGGARFRRTWGGRTRTAACRASAPGPRRPRHRSSDARDGTRGRAAATTRVRPATRVPPGAPRSRGVRVGVASRRPAVGTLFDGDANGLESIRREASATSTIAASNASLLRADGSRYPLSLRTNWRAAASISPVVAVASGRRRILMLRHMDSAYTGCAVRSVMPRCRASPRRRRSRPLTAGLSSVPMDLPRTIIEPFKIKMVEPIKLTTRDEREADLEAADFNLFQIHAGGRDHRPADRQRHVAR